jgi:hypothetical protein
LEINNIIPYQELKNVLLYKQKNLKEETANAGINPKIKYEIPLKCHLIMMIPQKLLK